MKSGHIFDDFKCGILQRTSPNLINADAASANWPAIPFNGPTTFTASIGAANAVALSFGPTSSGNGSELSTGR